MPCGGDVRGANAFFMGHGDSARLLTGPGNRRWTVGSPSTPKKKKRPLQVDLIVTPRPLFSSPAQCSQLHTHTHTGTLLCVVFSVSQLADTTGEFWSGKRLQDFSFHQPNGLKFGIMTLTS